MPESIQVTSQGAGNQAAIQSQGSSVEEVTRNASPALSPEEVAEISKGAKVIITEILSNFLDYTIISSYLNKWWDADRKLPPNSGTPHLDKGFQLLEKTNVDIRSWRTLGMELSAKALDRLIHLGDSSRSRSSDLRWYLKKSNAYRDYLPGPDISALWQWEKILADELHEHVERGNLDLAEQKLSKVNITDRDDVAFALLQQLQDKELQAIAASPAGQALLTRLLDELSSSKYDEDERRQVERLKKAYSEWFLGRNDQQRQGEIIKSLEKWSHRIVDKEDLQKRETGDIFIIPIGSAGIGSGESTVSASLGNDGKIFVRVLRQSAHWEYAKQMPYYIEANGIWLKPDEPVVLKFVDQETARRFQSSTVLVPASFLLEISNEGTSEVVGKLLAWGLAGIFAPMTAASLIGLAGMEAGSAAVVAVGAATEAFGAFSLTINLARKDLINLYGEEARKFFAILDVVDMAVGVYGLGTLLYHAPSILKGLRNFPSKLRKEMANRKEAWLTAVEMAKLNRYLDESQKAANEVSKINKAVGGLSPDSRGPQSVGLPRAPEKPKALQQLDAISNGPSADISGLQASGISDAAPADTPRVSGNNAEVLSKFQAPVPGLTGLPFKHTRAPSGSNGGLSLVRTGTGASSVTGSKSVNVGELRPNHPPAADVDATNPKAPFGNKSTPDWVTDPAFLPQGRGAGPSGSGAAEVRLELPTPPPKPASGEIKIEGEGRHLGSADTSSASTAGEVTVEKGANPTTLSLEPKVTPPPGIQKGVDSITPSESRGVPFKRGEVPSKEWKPSPVSSPTKSEQLAKINAEKHAQFMKRLEEVKADLRKADERFNLAQDSGLEKTLPGNKNRLKLDFQKRIEILKEKLDLLGKNEGLQKQWRMSGRLAELRERKANFSELYKESGGLHAPDIASEIKSVQRELGGLIAKRVGEVGESAAMNEFTSALGRKNVVSGGNASGQGLDIMSDKDTILHVTEVKTSQGAEAPKKSIDQSNWEAYFVDRINNNMLVGKGKLGNLKSRQYTKIKVEEMRITNFDLKTGTGDYHLIELGEIELARFEELQSFLESNGIDVFRKKFQLGKYAKKP